MTEERWTRFVEKLRGTNTGNRPDHRDRFPVDLWEELSETGVFTSLTDTAKDGGAGLRAAVERIRELGRASADRGLTFSAVTQLASTVYCLRTFADSELRKRYLPAAEAGTAIGGHAITEAGAGSDVMNMSTTATRRGDTYVLSGTKRFITNAPVASLLVVYAKTIEDGEEKGLSAFLVETSWPGVDTSRAMPTAGLRSSPIGEVRLEEVSVPVGNRVGHAGAGFLILDQVMKREIVLAFAGNIGEMERVVRQSISYVNGREQFGSSIGSNQLVANRIVETQIAIELGGSLLDSIAERIDGFEDMTIPVAAAKIFISEANVTSVLNAIRVHGGNGYLDDSELPTDLLDALPGSIYSGANDLLRTKIATMLGVSS